MAVWSVLRDRSGRLWTGTFSSGLLLEENGKERSFPLPPTLGPSVGALLEDSRGRLWVGASLGLGLIENQAARAWPGDATFTNVNVRSIVEDLPGEALWVGTFGYGVWRVDLKQPGRVTHVEGLPRKRITSLAMDGDGCLWAGVFGEGLYCIRNGRAVPVGRRQGLSADTVGSILEDGRGWFWLGSDQGILRVSGESLHRVAQGIDEEAQFNVFDESDGMDIRECSEGFQPAAVRDSWGRLWFGTLRGVVRVDPASLRLNERPPPVVIEQFSFTDSSGTNHTLLYPGDEELAVPPGSTDLEFRYAALSYTAPEKVQYAHYLEGALGNPANAGKRRVALFQTLPPGRYRLKVRATNNDGLWSQRDATVAFTVQPFLWQTVWFRSLGLAGLAAAIGLGGWRVARVRYRGQIERLEQQRTLAHERARLAAVMEATTDLVAFADRHGHLLHLNLAGRRLLKLDEEAELGTLTLCNLFAPWAAQDLAQNGIPGAERNGTWQGESALRRRDGHEIPVSQVVIAHRDEAGQLGFVSMIARDISEQKRATEEKDRLQLQLGQAQKMESIGRLAGGVAHDFNNMLQVILGNVEMGLQQVPSNNLVHRELVAIRQAARRSAELTRQLLGFARKQAVSPRVLDLNETVDGVLKMLRPLLGESIHLTWQPGTDLWPVKIDPVQVDQILANLATNARDAVVGEGSVAVRTANFVVEPASENALSDSPAGEYVALTVSDTGRGMSPEVLEHLFEPFFTTKAVGKGTGLGLATVFGIVKQNQGTISVESQPNQGTTFRILLPRAPAPAPVKEGKRKALVGGTETVLLVEDEPQILDIGRRTLEKQGYTVLASNVPQSALDLAARHPGQIDLLVTDIVMPGMNGKELKQRLEALKPGIKCLYMSGYTDDIIARHGGLGPNEAFIEKPFSVQDLLDKVRSVLQDKFD